MLHLCKIHIYVLIPKSYWSFIIDLDYVPVFIKIKGFAKTVLLTQYLVWVFIKNGYFSLKHIPKMIFINTDYVHLICIDFKSEII